MQQQRTNFLESVIERSIRDWFQKNPKILYLIKGDRENRNKNEAAKKFMQFINESPRYKFYLKQIGIIDINLTDTGYLYLKRIAESIPVNSI